MYKKVMAYVVAICILVSAIPVYALATVINQDVTNAAAISSSMDTVSEANAISSQFSGLTSSAVLSDDRMVGNYSIRVVASEDLTTDYVEYTLVHSSTFSIDDYSTITLWVKPGASSSWISFFTNGSIINNDADHDGEFEVGSDLESGTWTKLTLNLLKTNPSISTGEDLVVRTNNNSTWFYDDIQSQQIKAQPLSLSSMVNDNTLINPSSGNLELNKNSELSGFVTTPSIIVSNSSYADSLKGNIIGINVDCGFMDLNANSTSETFATYYDATHVALSGDGKTLFYSSNNGLYKVDLETGLRTLLTTAITNIFALYSSDDGTKLFLGGTYNNSSYLLKYDVSTSATTTFRVDYTTFLTGSITNYGYILFCVDYYDYDMERHEFRIFSFNTTTKFLGGMFSVPTIYSFNSIGHYAFAIDNKLYLNGSSVTYTASSNITSLAVNNSGDVYFTTSSGLYLYTGSVQQLSTSTNIKILKYLSGANKLLLNGATYALSSGTITYLGFSASDSDNYGKVFLNGNTLYKDKNIRTNKYLISFDGKNTWYSYQDATWKKICTAPVPSTDNLITNGMTLAKINALTSSDFSTITSDIYTVDVAIYYTSGSTNVTPSISSIKIITDNSGKSVSLFAAKKSDFEGSQWRKINKIYPIEISPKEANYLYFFYADGKYSYYDGTSWQTEEETEIADLIADTEANWISLMQVGMTTQELRAIPESVLSEHLAGTDFSVVYCMQVADSSTVDYCSKITADYTKDYFSSTSLTLTVNFTDGSLQEFSDLTDTQVEDFMAWLHTRPSYKSSLYYTIESGNTSYYLNYYQIKSASVVQN